MALSMYRLMPRTRADIMSPSRLFNSNSHHSLCTHRRSHNSLITSTRRIITNLNNLTSGSSTACSLPSTPRLKKLSEGKAPCYYFEEASLQQKRNALFCVYQTRPTRLDHDTPDLRLKLFYFATKEIRQTGCSQFATTYHRAISMLVLK
jgi:hypothetical protein